MGQLSGYDYVYNLAGGPTAYQILQLDFTAEPTGPLVFSGATLGFDGALFQPGQTSPSFIYLGTTDASGDPVCTIAGTNTPVLLTSTPQSVFSAFDATQNLNLACFARGTLIATAAGEMPIERLRIGDRVITASGRARPIKWIGHRSYVRRFLASNPKAYPVRFSAGSLGAGLPRRDLLVSQEHAMFLHGALVPARCLVNDTSITIDRTLSEVAYLSCCRSGGHRD